MCLEQNFIFSIKVNWLLCVFVGGISKNILEKKIHLRVTWCVFFYVFCNILWYWSIYSSQVDFSKKVFFVLTPNIPKKNYIFDKKYCFFNFLKKHIFFLVFALSLIKTLSSKRWISHPNGCSLLVFWNFR